MARSLVGFIVASLVVVTTHASPHIGTLVFFKGSVQVLSEPAATSQNRSPEALYEGMYFQVKDPKIGFRLRKGEVLQTGPNGRAKVIFNNGDQIMVGPGTSYRLLWSENTSGKDDKNMLHIFYGKVRAVISHKGPRKKLDVKTPSAVAGVRGTDFYIAHNGDRGTEVTVLRGQVAVAKGRKQVKSVLVKQGYSAQVAESSKQEKVEVTEASKEKLEEIQVASKSEKIDPATLPKDVQKTVTSLEQKATQSVIEEIKETQPELINAIGPDGLKSADLINAAIVTKLQAQAPAEKIKKKPTAGDLKGPDKKEVYKKYYQEKKND